MQMIWKTSIFVVIALIIILSGYFYYIGNNDPNNSSNITIVKRIIAKQDNTAIQKTQQIDQAVASLCNDVAKIKDGTAVAALNEITQDLKGF